MKIIMRVSIIAALLLTLCGVSDIQARRWSPGHAEAKAMRGDFHISEKDQLLADIPEEWKREHRRLVRDIQEGYWGRGSRKRGEIIEEDVIVEKPELEIEVDEEEFANEGSNDEKLQEILEISDKGKEVKEKLNIEERPGTEDQKAIQDIAYNFGRNINAIYGTGEREVGGLWTKELVPQKSGKIKLLNQQNFEKKFENIITYQNDFFKHLKNLEDAMIQDKYENVDLSGSLFLTALNGSIQKSENREIVPQLKLLAQEFNLWVRYRMINIVGYKEFFPSIIKRLNSENFRKRFADLMPINEMIKQKEKESNLIDFEEKKEKLVVDKNKIVCNSTAKVSMTFLNKLAADIDLDKLSPKDIEGFKSGQDKGGLWSLVMGNQQIETDSYQYPLLDAVLDFGKSNNEDSKTAYNNILKKLKQLAETCYCFTKGKTDQSKNISLDSIALMKRDIIKVLEKFEKFLQKNEGLWIEGTGVNSHESFFNSLKQLFM